MCLFHRTCHFWSIPHRPQSWRHTCPGHFWPHFQTAPHNTPHCQNSPCPAHAAHRPSTHPHKHTPEKDPSTLQPPEPNSLQSALNKHIHYYRYICHGHVHYLGGMCLSSRSRLWRRIDLCHGICCFSNYPGRNHWGTTFRLGAGGSLGPIIHSMGLAMGGGPVWPLMLLRLGRIRLFPGLGGSSPMIFLNCFDIICWSLVLPLRSSWSDPFYYYINALRKTEIEKVNWNNHIVCSSKRIYEVCRFQK